MRPVSNVGKSMTRYRLSDDLSFCLVDERPIFLDLRGDRYFRLSGQIEKMFLRWVSGESMEAGDLALLIERRILEADLSGVMHPGRSVRHPRVSVLELPAAAGAGVFTFLEVFYLVLLTRIQLKTIGFSATARRALSLSSEPPKRNDDSDVSQHSNAAQDFLSSRRLVPLNTSCLLDSLAMARFIKRRQLDVTVVIGVTDNPFRAHCWVQASDVILSDALGNVRIYTPIKVL